MIAKLEKKMCLSPENGGKGNSDVSRNEINFVVDPKIWIFTSFIYLCNFILLLYYYFTIMIIIIININVMPLDRFLIALLLLSDFFILKIQRKIADK